MSQYQLPSKCSATGKSRFATPGEAKEAMIRIKARPRFFTKEGKRVNRKSGKPGLCRHYYCKYCKGFHITSMTAPPLQKTITSKIKEKVKNTQGLIKSEEEGKNWKSDGLPFPNTKNTEE